MIDDAEAQRQMADLMGRLIRECNGEPAWLVHAAHVACILNLACRDVVARPSIIARTQKIVAVMQELGTAEGAEADTIVRSFEGLFARPDGLH